MKALKSKFKSNIIIYLKGVDKSSSFSQDTVLNIESIDQANTLDQLVDCLFNIFSNFSQEKVKESPNVHSFLNNEDKKLAFALRSR